MFNTLPITMVFSVLLWASMIYTIMGCVQLILFDTMAKKEDPKATSYKKMSPKNKKGIRKAFIKIFLGMLSLITLALIDKILLLHT
jgi:archaellum biogenesis protein FlaJ (TadC family)